MRVTIAAATIAIAALVAGPASADANLGGAVKQNGQCWSGSRTLGCWHLRLLGGASRYSQHPGNSSQAPSQVIRIEQPHEPRQVQLSPLIGLW